MYETSRFGRRERLKRFVMLSFSMIESCKWDGKWRFGRIESLYLWRSLVRQLRLQGRLGPAVDVSHEGGLCCEVRHARQAGHFDL
jgi:hypothetical protein